jgi:hypothetical protein
MSLQIAKPQHHQPAEQRKRGIEHVITSNAHRFRPSA